ncbi:MAG: MlaD family protein [Deltaproteobacteria bacterium]|jgi:phospholipid/cholesterol/gamma-HCH transport system substrate-binding protein|nr:MlaD family protein [Deltaproteobacteria bacterium]
MTYTWSEKIAGLILLLGFSLIALAMVLVGAGRDWLSNYQNYFALFQSGHGLMPGVKVKFLRLDIGRVTNLELTDDNLVKIHLAILTDYSSRLKGDSLASIKSPTIIGSEYIEIIPGGTQSFPIPSGGQIPAKNPQTVEELITSLKLEEKLSQFETIMANIATITDVLKEAEGPFLGTLENIHQATEAVVEREGALGALIYDRELYEELLTTLNELKSITANMSKTSTDLRKDLPGITTKLENILKQVETGTRSFPDMSREARESLRAVDQILNSVKRNFLIRANLTPEEPPESLTRPARER